MITKTKKNDFELEIDSRELTAEELIEIKDFIRKDKEKNIDKLNVQKPYLKRKMKGFLSYYLYLSISLSISSLYSQTDTKINYFENQWRLEIEDSSFFELDTLVFCEDYYDEEEDEEEAEDEEEDEIDENWSEGELVDQNSNKLINKDQNKENFNESIRKYNSQSIKSNTDFNSENE